MSGMFHPKGMKIKLCKKREKICGSQGREWGVMRNAALREEQY